MLLSVTAGIDFSAFADKDYSGTYTLDEATGTLIISGNGTMEDVFSRWWSDPYGDFEHYERAVHFSDNQEIKHIIINEGITEIGFCEFANCKNLKIVSIPKSVHKIDSSAFINCTSLEEFIVSPDNEEYCSSEGGVLYNKDKTALVTYPYARQSEKYHIFKTVRNICENAFKYCTNLKTLTIPNRVKSIPEEAFGDTNSINTVIYKGTINEWLEVRIWFTGGYVDNTESAKSYKHADRKNSYCFRELEEYEEAEDGELCYRGNRAFDNIIVLCSDGIAKGDENYCYDKDAKITKKPTFNSTGTRVYTFNKTGETYTATIPKLGKPSISKLTKGKKRFTAKWKKVDGVGGYQLQYSTYKSFKKAKKVKIKGNKTFKKTVKKLKGKKKYYVRIRAYKKINGKTKYSKWSAKKSVKTK